MQSEEQTLFVESGKREAQPPVRFCCHAAGARPRHLEPDLELLGGEAVWHGTVGPVEVHDVRVHPN